MNYANDNFRTWYLSADPNPDTNTMKARIDLIKQNVKTNRKLEFWQDLVRLYLDIPMKDITNAETFVKIFRDADENFPTTNNENLIRCLASITLCFKLEILNNKTNNLISLAVLNSNFLEQYQVYDAIPVSSFASQYLSNSSILARELNIENIVLNLDKIPEILADDSIAPTNKAVQAVIVEIKAILQTNKALAEESNILWWLFGEYCKTCDNFFKNVEFSDLIVIAAKELSEITAFNNGLNSAVHVLNKVLHVGRSTKTKETSLVKVINSLSTETKKELIGESSAKLNEFTPCLNALVKSLEEPSGKEWSNSYKEMYPKVDVNRLSPPLNLSIQFYREFLYVKNRESKQ